MFWGLNQKWITKDTNKPTSYFVLQVFYMRKQLASKGTWRKKTRQNEPDMRCRHGKSWQRVEPIVESAKRKRWVSSWRSAKSRKNRSKEDHCATTFGTVGQRWNGMISNLRLNHIAFKDGFFPGLDWDKQLLEKSQAFAACRTKESEVTYFHKAAWQDVL